MVYIAPLPKSKSDARKDVAAPKVRQRVQAGHKQAADAKQGKRVSALGRPGEKPSPLEELVRQAAENTRVLERELAQLRDLQLQDSTATAPSHVPPGGPSTLQLFPQQQQQELAAGTAAVGAHSDPWHGSAAKIPGAGATAAGPAATAGGGAGAGAGAGAGGSHSNTCSLQGAGRQPPAARRPLVKQVSSAAAFGAYGAQLAGASPGSSRVAVGARTDPGAALPPRPPPAAAAAASGAQGAAPRSGPSASAAGAPAASGAAGSPSRGAEAGGWQADMSASRRLQSEPGAGGKAAAAAAAATLQKTGWEDASSSAAAGAGGQPGSQRVHNFLGAPAKVVCPSQVPGLTSSPVRAPRLSQQQQQQQQLPQALQQQQQQRCTGAGKGRTDGFQQHAGAGFLAAAAEEPQAESPFAAAAGVPAVWPGSPPGAGAPAAGGWEGLASPPAASPPGLLLAPAPAVVPLGQQVVGAGNPPASLEQQQQQQLRGLQSPALLGMPVWPASQLVPAALQDLAACPQAPSLHASYDAAAAAAAAEVGGGLWAAGQRSSTNLAPAGEQSMGSGVGPGAGSPGTAAAAAVAAAAGPGVAAGRVLAPEEERRQQKILKQQQYKAELEAQIRERGAAKAAAAAALQQQEAREAAARAAAPPPWDPVARAYRPGGGGEPLKAADGSLVADLRGLKGRLQGSTSDLAGQVAAAAAWLPYPADQVAAAGAAGGRVGMSMAGLQTSGGSISGSNAAAAGAAGNITRTRSFLSALAELQPGPTAAQRAAAEAARQQLQQDLQAQVAEKAARKAQEEAAEVAAVAREQAALRAYYAKQQQQQQQQQGVPGGTGIAAAAAAAAGQFLQPEGSGLQVQQPQLLAPVLQGLGGGPRLPVSPSSTAVVPAVPGLGDGSTSPARRRKGRSTRVIDAPWLDEAAARQQLQQQQQQQLLGQQLPTAERGPLGSSSQHGLAAPAALLLQPQQPNPQQQQQPERAASGGARADAVAELLTQLRAEQEAMREDFARQAALLEQLAQEKEAAAAQAGAAWEELLQVKQQLMQATAAGGSSSSSGVPGPSGRDQGSFGAARGSRQQQQRGEGQEGEERGGGGRRLLQGRQVGQQRGRATEQQSSLSSLMKVKPRPGVRQLASRQQQRRQQQQQPLQWSCQEEQQGLGTLGANSTSSSVQFLRASTRLRPLSGGISGASLDLAGPWQPSPAAAAAAGGGGEAGGQLQGGEGLELGPGGDALDGFMVETHLVPLSVSGMPPALLGIEPMSQDQQPQLLLPPLPQQQQGQQSEQVQGLVHGAQTSQAAAAAAVNGAPAHTAAAAAPRARRTWASPWEEEGSGREEGGPPSSMEVSVTAPFHGCQLASKNGRYSCQALDTEASSASACGTQQGAAAAAVAAAAAAPPRAPSPAAPRLPPRRAKPGSQQHEPGLAHLAAGWQPQQQQQQQPLAQHSWQAPPSPPILRADHLPSPERPSSPTSSTSSSRLHRGGPGRHGPVLPARRSNNKHAAAVAS